MINEVSLYSEYIFIEHTSLPISSRGTVVWSFGKGGSSMLDLFFSSQGVALSASACPLQRPLREAANTKALKKENVRSLETLAASPATFCLQPIRQVGYVIFRHKWFRKSSSLHFTSGFRHFNQSARNVTSVTSVTTKFKKLPKNTSTSFNALPCPTLLSRSGEVRPSSLFQYQHLSAKRGKLLKSLKGPEGFLAILAIFQKYVDATFDVSLQKCNGYLYVGERLQHADVRRYTLQRIVGEHLSPISLFRKHHGKNETG
jgi:hypothetical protein